MKKWLLLFFISITINSFSQTKEWMVLQKHGRNIKTYFTGNYIQLQLDNFQWLEGYIKFFRNDSIFFMQESPRIVYSAWGLPMRDTLHFGLLSYSIKQIYALPLERQGVGVIESGAIFQAAGAGYIFLNAANSLIKSDNFFTAQNLTGVGIAAGVFLFGKILQWNHPTKIILGKKYTLQSIKMGDN